MESCPRRPRVTSVQLLCGGLLLALAARPHLATALTVPVARTAATVFAAVCVQALPFLALGVVLSGAVAAFVPPATLGRLLPASPPLAVAVAGAAGVALPGCECAAVPLARRLVDRGVPEAAALAFLLAAPAVNPVVLVATAVAFPGQPRMVLARLAGSLATAWVTGWLWPRLRPGAGFPRRPAPAGAPGRPLAVLVETARHDLVEAGGFLVLGGLATAVLTVLVPPVWTAGLAGRPVLAVAAMAGLAVVLALCSEADAFVAASFTTVPLLPRLVFLVVGPAVDVKLVALQAGAFGRAVAARLAPLTFAVAVACAVAAGLVLL